MRTIDCAGKVLDLEYPQVMGILNVTPDSFSDGGDFVSRDSALAHARQMQREGAAIIDIGGESTRPGAAEVPEQQELDRVIPVIEAISAEIDLPISIDTSKPVVMREAVAAGAGLINDVLALRTEGAKEIVSQLSVPVCLMHMQGVPRTMQQAPIYSDVISDVADFLQHEMNACVDAGIRRDRILLDPGFGFGKTLQHNLELLSKLGDLLTLGAPILAGTSRKSMIGTILGDVPIEDRLFGSVAAAVMAADRGVAILRVHDVKATVDALKVVGATRRAIHKST